MKKPTLPVVMSLILLMLSLAGAEDLIHVLQKGETLYGVSKKYNVSPSMIMTFNNIDDPAKLRAGQKLKIPNAYIVQKGDTVYGIARKLNIPVDELMAANKLTNDSKLKTGETLYVPSSKSAASATASTALTVPASAQSTAASTAASVPAELDTAIPSRKPFIDPREFEKRKVDGSIIWPVSAKEISYLSGKVYGVSITSGVGEKVKVISSGTVLSIGPYRGFGQVLFLQSKTGYIYVYGGMDTIVSKPGQNLAFGDEIGTLGADSLSGTPRLYFMVYNKDSPIDPAKAPRGY
jgi:murein DD-endopeptidase MepM/ murein hydrolase activator NlpD